MLVYWLTKAGDITVGRNHSFKTQGYSWGNTSDLVHCQGTKFLFILFGIIFYEAASLAYHQQWKSRMCTESVVELEMHTVDSQTSQAVDQCTVTYWTVHPYQGKISISTKIPLCLVKPFPDHFWIQIPPGSTMCVPDNVKLCGDWCI